MRTVKRSLFLLLTLILIGNPASAMRGPANSSCATTPVQFATVGRRSMVVKETAGGTYLLSDGEIEVGGTPIPAVLSFEVDTGTPGGFSLVDDLPIGGTLEGISGVDAAGFVLISRRASGQTSSDLVLAEVGTAGDLSWDDEEPLAEGEVVAICALGEFAILATRTPSGGSELLQFKIDAAQKQLQPRPTLTRSAPTRAIATTEDGFLILADADVLDTYELDAGLDSLSPDPVGSVSLPVTGEVRDVEALGKSVMVGTDTEILFYTLDRSGQPRLRHTYAAGNGLTDLAVDKDSETLSVSTEGSSGLPELRRFTVRKTALRPLCAAPLPTILPPSALRSLAPTPGATHLFFREYDAANGLGVTTFLRID